MSQRKEKYARNMERRTGALEERVSSLEERQRMTGRKMVEYECALSEVKSDAGYAITLNRRETGARQRNETETAKESRRRYREIERSMSRQRTALVIALALAVLALIAAIQAMGTKQAAASLRQPDAAPQIVPSAIVTATIVETDRPAIEMERVDQRTVEPEEPMVMEQIGEEVEIQDYFSAAVPLCREYQDYMRTYCLLYECPYSLALAVADWETRGEFDMDAVGSWGEVGIFQLLPGPNGTYHAELEEATGLDPTTPEGNIAGGCYLLGKYMAQYDDVTKAAMAYNMGQAGARKAWNAGITSNSYSDAVLAAMERWESVVGGCTMK